MAKLTIGPGQEARVCEVAVAHTGETLAFRAYCPTCDELLIEDPGVACDPKGWYSVGMTVNSRVTAKKLPPPS